MELKEVERIKDLINKNEIEKAKAQGVKESIKKQWKEKFGTDEEIQKLLNDYNNNLELNQPENNIDKLTREEAAHAFRLKELIIDHCKVIVNLALDDHIFHEIFHSRCIFMVYLHMFSLIEDHVCIEICKLLLIKGVLVIKVHQN